MGLCHFLSSVLLFSVLGTAALAANPVTAVPESTQQVRLSYAPLVKQTAPAVVNIYTKTVVQQRYLTHPLFQQFFGDMIPPEGITRERVQNSLGSGVIVQPNGVVVTANHVIANATEIRVVLNDRREFPATILTQDERTDLAVLKINVKEQLPFLPLADSDALEVGDLVLAIGNPFGVGQTVTTGIISALARSNVGITDYNYFIQTDAAINPGNSGGALVTMQGNLAGINSAIFSKDGGSLGIGFAIPATMVQRIVEASATGATRVTRPWLGIGGQPVTPELATSLNVPRPAGVLVNYLHSASPAKAAGLKTGDVIIAFNGKPVDDPEALKFRAGSEKIGGRATLSVIRKGEPEMVSVDLIAPPERPKKALTELKTGNHPLLGASIANISPALLDEYGLTTNEEHGVLIVDMARNAFGFRTGDRLIAINGTEINAVDDVVALLPRLAQGGTFVIERDGRTLRLVIGQ